MLELHGVFSVYDSNDLALWKRRSLLFDKVHCIESYMWNELDKYDASVRADLSFLLESGYLVEMVDLQTTPVPECFMGIQKMRQILPLLQPADRILNDSSEDIGLRVLAMFLSNKFGINTAPVCRRPDCLSAPSPNSSLETVLNIGLKALPNPDDSCAWEDILNFKSECHGKAWEFRRFLNTLATKHQTDAEVRDDIEWSLNEYSKAMELHKLKASQSFVDVFVITPLEIIENLVTFNWSKIAKGALQVSKRKVELMEAEMKAPGRECAYVFDARKRFGAR
jgi:hypothetical protein